MSENKENKKKNRSCCWVKDKVENNENNENNKKEKKGRSCILCNCFGKNINDKEEENRLCLENYLKQQIKYKKENNYSKSNSKLNLNPPGGIDLELDFELEDE